MHQLSFSLAVCVIGVAVILVVVVVFRSNGVDGCFLVHGRKRKSDMEEGNVTEKEASSPVKESTTHSKEQEEDGESSYYNGDDGMMGNDDDYSYGDGGEKAAGRTGESLVLMMVVYRTALMGVETTEH